MATRFPACIAMRATQRGVYVVGCSAENSVHVAFAVFCLAH